VIAYTTIDWEARAAQHWLWAEEAATNAQRYLHGSGSPDTERARTSAAIGQLHAALSEQAGARAYLSYSFRNVEASKRADECSCCDLSENVAPPHQRADNPCAVHPERPFGEGCEE